MSTEEQIQELELTIDQAREQVKLAEALNRLHKNEDFKAVILDGYFRDEASRLVALLADPNCQTDAWQNALTNSVRSISELRQHFAKTFHFGELAARAIDDANAAIVEIENENQEEN